LNIMSTQKSDSEFVKPSEDKELIPKQSTNQQDERILLTD